jgi:signal transduction histidine kinase
MIAGSRQLQAADQYLQENAPLLYLLVDADGRLLDGNAYSRNLLGRDLQGLAMDDVFLTFGRPLDIASLRDHPEQVQMLSLTTGAGLPETLLCHFTAVNDNTLIFGALDADEMRRLRREMVVLNNQMSGLTRELQKKNHQLVELNQLKNQFLGMAAHDLRKPVSAILNYSEFLLDEAGSLLNPEHLGFLQTIHASTDLMRHLIDDFLDIALIESGRFPLNPAAVDILRPVQRSMALQHIIALKRKIDLRLIPPKDSLILTMDEYKIEQVLNNLISNAIEHSPPDSQVIVRISGTETEVLVTVTDAGPGITEGEREKIFAPYARGEARKVADTRSTGLGLAISKKIIEAHKGRIWAENLPGLGPGASFCFLLSQNLGEHSHA